MNLHLLRVIALVCSLCTAIPFIANSQTNGDYRANIGFLQFEDWSDRTVWERYNSGTGTWATPTVLQGYPGQFVTPTNVTVNFTFISGLAIDVSLNLIPLNNLTVSGLVGFVSTSGNVNVSLNGNLVIGGTTQLNFGGTGAFTVNGTTQISGTFQDSGGAGITTFVGQVDNNGTFTSTAVNAPANMIFRGGIDNSNTFNGGAATFNTNNQSLIGTANITFVNNVIVNGPVLTNSNTATFQVGGTFTLQGGGDFTDNSNNGIDIFGGLVTVNNGTIFTSTAVTTTGNLIFRGGIANAGAFVAGGATFDSNNQTISGGNAISFANSIEINGALVNVTNTSTFTVTGTTTLNTSGGFTDSNNTNYSRFIGNVDIDANTTFSSTAVNTTGNMNFRGGINNNGTVNAGAASFTTNAQALSGTGNTSFGSNVLIDGILLTNSNTGALSITGTTTLSTAGGFTDSSNSGTNTFTGNVSVGSSTTFTSTAATTAANTVFRGGILQNGTFNAGGATFDTNAQSITGNNAVSFAGNVDITGSLVTMSNGNTLFIGGTTTLTISGGFTRDNGNAVTTLVGNVSVGAGTTFTTTSVFNNANLLIFRGGITNNGTFNGGAATFNTNSQSLTGSNAINFNSFVVVTGGGVTVTNSNAAAVNLTATNSPVLDGTGRWTQDTNSTLNFNGTSITINTFNASAVGNTVNYNRSSAQTIYHPSSPNNAYHHLTLSGGGTKTSANNLDINGNLTISGTAVLDVASGNDDINIAGNWVVTSTVGDPFLQGTRTVVFDGSTNQTITTSVPAGETFNNLRFDNSAVTPAITINDAISVTAALTMTDGVVNLNSNSITLGTSAASPGTLAHAGTAANGWVYGGTLRRYVNAGAIAVGGIAGYFPVGSTADFRPFSFSGAVATGGLVTVIHNDATTSPAVNFQDGVPFVVKRHDANWVVTSTVATTANNAVLNIRGEGTGYGTIGSVDDIRIVHLNDALNMGTAGTNSGTPANPVVNRTGLRGSQLAGTYYIGSINNNTSPLPIQLVSFSATLRNDQVELNWRTASELNNHYFTIERTNNLEKFDSLAAIDGAGTTSEARTYTRVDHMPLFGRSYYRLKQTDFDGQYTYSKVVTIEYAGPRFASIYVYPNPTEVSSINVVVNGLKEQTSIPIQVVDSRGIVLFEKTYEIGSPGVFQEQLQLPASIGPGLYFVRSGQAFNLIQKLIVK